VGGTVTVDGEKWGELGEYLLNTGILGMYHRWRYPDSPMSERVGINLAVGAAAVFAGVHRIEVSKPGLPTRSIEFAYPFREASEVCTVALLSDSTLVSRECEVRRGAG
jgi:hypothetical protein